MTKLIKSNIYKDRGILVAFLLIIIISVMLLHIGLFLGTYEGEYDSRYVSGGYLEGGIITTAGNKDEIQRLIEDVSDVSKARACETIMNVPFEYTIGSSDKEIKLDSASFYTFDNYRLSDTMDFIDRDESVQGAKIYMNLYTAYKNRIKVGDELHLKSEVFGDYDFTVAGIYEDLVEGNAFSYYSVIVDDESYEKLDKKADEIYAGRGDYFKRICTFCEFNEGVDQADGVVEVKEALLEAGYVSSAYVSNLAKEGYIGIVNIVSGFLTTFAVIIVAICLIMIIFTVNNNIDRDIVNIGALRAVGHTTSQVRNALAMEYLLLGLMGSCVGSVLAYIVMPVFDEKILRQLSGIYWDEHFYPVITLGIILIMLAVILIVVCMSTAKIRNLHPATALRFGLKANSFNRNYLPLAETSGNLNILLALKSTFQNVKQNIVVLGIISVVGFLTMFSALLIYNTRVDITMFQRLMQGDAPDAYVDTNAQTEEEMYEIIDRLQNMEEVSQAYGLATETCSVAGYDTTILYVSNPEYVYCGLYEGEMIKEDNEAVIGKVTAEKAGVDIGDEIEIEYNGNKARYLVTGFQQAVFGFGERVYITDDGARRLGLDIDHHYIRIRVKDATPGKVDEVLKDVENILGDQLVDTENWLKHNKSNDNESVYAISLTVGVLVILNIVTILIVIRLLLKTVFIRREKEFGIKKAVGFTSKQLRIQLALSLIPMSLAASVFGAVMAYFLTNPLFSLIFRRYGVMRAELIMKAGLIVFTFVIVTMLVFVFSYIMSRRMKRVSAYRLIQE